MPNAQERSTWAREACLAVFRDKGLALREDDSIILFAAVLRSVLDSWLIEHDGILTEQTNRMEDLSNDWQLRFTEVLEFQVKTIRAKLQDDVQQAAYRAEQAVAKALSISGKDTHWKHRMQGAIAGVILTLVCFLLARM
jgi:hypothetical protein